MARVQYFDSYTQDMVALPPVDTPDPRALSREYNSTVYAAAKAFAELLCRGALHVRVQNEQVLDPYRGQGYFLYGNHTQPMGDAFLPMLLAKGVPAKTIANVANLQVPIIGPYIQAGGALVVPPDLHGMPAFLQTVTACIQAGEPVTIYPEAHVWPYDTQIRPFTRAAFHYPVTLQVPSFAMTSTYQARRLGTKPKITVYLDGPFWPDSTLSTRQAQQQLADTVHGQMVKRAAQFSTYAYIDYRKRVTS